MFKKKCRKCGKKLEKDFTFCPYCGNNLRREEDERKYGFLGKDDSLDFSELGINMPFGFNKLFSSLLNQIDSQFKELDKEIGKEIKKQGKEKPKLRSRGISVSISSLTGKKPEIRIRGFGPEFKGLAEEGKIERGKEIKEVKIEQPKISEYKARKLAKLPKQEAETKVRRLSNKIVYEIVLPGVKKLSDVIINKLENSIEIKAFSKDKAYFKLIPLNLPILNYKLKGEKLILELKAK